MRISKNHGLMLAIGVLVYLTFRPIPQDVCDLAAVLAIAALLTKAFRA
jgi:hypothetical protein